MGIISNIKLNIKHRKVYKPFFLCLNTQYDKLSLIDSQIPNNITEIYKQLLNSKKRKYLDSIKKYDEYITNVSEHNKKVNIIENGIVGYFENEVLDSPATYPSDKLNKYYKVAVLINGFKEMDPKYIEFKKSVFDIHSNINNIIVQRKLFDDLVHLFNGISKHQYIDARIKNVYINHVNLAKNTLKSFDKIYYDFSKFDIVDSIVKQHNIDFIDRNLNNPLFDNINGKSLDKEQRESVLTDELSTLVIAGAGSGKTLTICGKVVYLLKEKNINPDEILLLSYSNESSTDLRDKVHNIDKRLTVGTFHKLGLSILKDPEGKKFDVEQQYSAIIEDYFRKELKNRPHMLQTVLTYYGLYLISDKHEKKYEDKGQLYEDLKKADFTTLKNQLVTMTNDVYNKETIKKEKVKSFEELAIANWYFINGIEYNYEAPYEIDTSTPDKRQYLPDFYLPDYKIYHEHYGINREGKAEQYESSEAQKYVDTIRWKRNIHSEYSTTCLETYSYEFSEGIVFTNLEKKLKDRGVKFNPLSNDEIYNALQSIYDGQSFKSFINLISSFLSLYKSTYPTVDGFENLKHYRFANSYERQRANLFLKIVKDVYLYYIDYIKSKNRIDFDDMILKSINAIDQTDDFKYKYIIVDEFQDISVSRMKFLKKVIKHGNSKLFVVGDDWQAIYRFSGCDLNIFLRFSDYFGESAITKITSTHRNSQELQDIAGPFIRKNPEQFDKTINSVKHLENPVQIMYYSDKKYFAFLDVLKEISVHDPKANVLVLGRNNADIESIKIDNRIYVDEKKSTKKKLVVLVDKYPEMKITYCTAHSSKGLEEDYVIILNADDSRWGFPNKMEDDELLDMVLSSKSSYEFAEERRLWYVALTRTRSYTYIIAKNTSPSIFVKEIEEQCMIINPQMEINHDDEIKCPLCKSGRLVLRTNEKNNSNFYGCSSYPYCDYSIKDLRNIKNNHRCKLCGDFMLLKSGKYGKFYGCHNYPRCNYTEKI